MDPWESLAEWCEEHALKTRSAILPPSTSYEISAAQGGTGGILWPEDVLAFYEWRNGLERTPDGYLFPGLRPLRIDEVVANWQSFMDIAYEDVRPSPPPRDADSRMTFYGQLAVDVIGPECAQPAGSVTGRFIPSLLPIAEDQNGSYLMIDRRGGKEFGAAVFYDKVDADLNDAPRWKSFLALSRATLQAVISETPEEQTGLTPIALGGRLIWQ
ncbi:SMI1/KNR4 family protein [Pseudonocardia sp. ICBG1293]|uniref:SMI1/KNR4 family protein n=1 Tax=Pseudonocardia sp. ICBG1293 TaxID=2844382 RepID=UPI001CCE3624|nr:SMI1/KNR4 family protein [Pseudonocardia sp. ICBG1293]